MVAAAIRQVATVQSPSTMRFTNTTATTRGALAHRARKNENTQARRMRFA